MINSNLIRYVIIAILAYIVDLGGFWGLIKLGNDPIVSNLIVKITAAIFGFTMHRRYTYKITGNDGIAMHAFKYFGLASIYTPMSTLVLYILLNYIASPIFSKITSDILLFFITYIITTHVVFVDSKKRSN